MQGGPVIIKIFSLFNFGATVNCVEYQTIKADYQMSESSQCQKWHSAKGNSLLRFPLALSFCLMIKV